MPKERKSYQHAQLDLLLLQENRTAGLITRWPSDKCLLRNHDSCEVCVSTKPQCGLESNKNEKEASGKSLNAAHGKTKTQTFILCSFDLRCFLESFQWFGHSLWVWKKESTCTQTTSRQSWFMQLIKCCFETGNVPIHLKNNYLSTGTFDFDPNEWFAHLWTRLSAFTAPPDSREVKRRQTAFFFLNIFCSISNMNGEVNARYCISEFLSA